ncbi:condensin complex subunit 2 [Silene latifolia]|uniref:condensin complex subunit 2 n=1 Tax=Silene latifolia TaxID=37657 RepID=UPI003D7716A5
MAETLINSPNPTPGLKRRPSISTRLQSPTSPFLLGSNDDQLERAQARAARAAAIRRKALDVSFENAIPSDSDSPLLDGQQIMELFRNCIKLASENKINQKNTWELKLIDHLSEIIKVEDEDDTETNFQKASCTLEAGVKIYALRVDSVHSEAYKVLGGISRAGLEDQPENVVEGDNDSGDHDANQSKKESERKLSPLSTLESSFESLNVKKFDVAFAVDPLYHQTTAQFDEGGAKGLLLNNLGIYGGCRVLFDSQEVPAKGITSTAENNFSDLIDVSFAGEWINQMVNKVNIKQDICPTFRMIVDEVDDFRLERALFHRSQETLCDDDANDGSTIELDGGHVLPNMDNRPDDQGTELGDGTYDNGEGWSFGHNDDADFAHDSNNFDINDQNLHDQYEEQDSFSPCDPDAYDRVESVASLLLAATGNTSSQNAWAGPEHWKYRKTKGPESVMEKDSEVTLTAKRPRAKKTTEVDIDFIKALDEDMPDIFAPPKNLKSLLLPSKKAPLSNKLPEDCHYQPEDLVKLFLLPNVMCLGKRRRKLRDSGWQDGNDMDEPGQAWDNGSAYGDPENGDYGYSDAEEQDMLVSQPRQVNKIEVQYDKAAKQVDVHLLKETLWDHMHNSKEVLVTNVDEDALSFKKVLANFPDDCAAAAPQDISPHLCFICLLHLANEHGLRILGCESMDELTIHLPASCQETGRS